MRWPRLLHPSPCPLLSPPLSPLLLLPLASPLSPLLLLLLLWLPAIPGPLGVWVLEAISGLGR